MALGFPIKILDDVKKIDIESLYTIALKNDGTVWAWGCGINQSKESFCGNGEEYKSTFVNTGFSINDKIDAVIDWFGVSENNKKEFS